MAPTTAHRCCRLAVLGDTNAGCKLEACRAEADNFRDHFRLDVDPVSIATSPARSTFPVGSMGSSFSARRRMTVGTLNVDRLRRAWATMVSTDNRAPWHGTTAAATTSPRTGCGKPTTKLCRTSGIESSTDSTSAGETLDPAVLINALARPVKCRWPASSNHPRSPVAYQPSGPNTSWRSDL